MPNRIIKESICTSENIDSLTPFQETFFYRLIVNCDDYGRMDARPKILAARLFPLRDVRSNQIEDALRALTSAELVTLYIVDGKPFLQMNTWDRHQQVRAKKSKYPAFDGTTVEDVDTCNQMISSDNKCPRNPIQSESNPNPNPNPNTTRKRDEPSNFDFDVFWSAYPRHEDKQAARRAFDKIRPDEQLMQKMIASIAAWKESDQWQEKQYIPHPSTWLNGKRWEDDPPPPRIAKTVVAQQYGQRDYSGVQDDLMDEQSKEYERRIREKQMKKVNAQLYEQRDYSGTQDELMAEQDREMEEWLRKEASS